MSRSSGQGQGHKSKKNVCVHLRGGLPSIETQSCSNIATVYVRVHNIFRGLYYVSNATSNTQEVCKPQ